jgi:hypothetical protein
VQLEALVLPVLPALPRALLLVLVVLALPRALLALLLVLVVLALPRELLSLLLVLVVLVLREVWERPEARVVLLEAEVALEGVQRAAALPEYQADQVLHVRQQSSLGARLVQLDQFGSEPAFSHRMEAIEPDGSSNLR